MDRDENRLWHYYEQGRAYNSSMTPSQYKVVETNTEFFNGNQWIHMPKNEAMKKLAKPVFNIIKRVATMFVASLTSSSTTIRFEALTDRAGAEAAEFATAEVRNLLEKFKFDYAVRDALTDGAITGDYAAHFYWNPEARPYGGTIGEQTGEIEMEMVEGINVMFGNPNLGEVERQPYVILVGRDTVENLKREAVWWRKRGAAAVAREPPAENDGFAQGDVLEGFSPDREPGERTGDEDGFYGFGPGKTVTVPGSAGAGPGMTGTGPGMAEAESGVRLWPDDGYGKIRRPLTLEEEAELFGDINITADSEGEEYRRDRGLVGGDDRTGKALYIYYYSKEWKDENYVNPITGNIETRKVQTVHVSKATRNCFIYEDVDTGLSYYPMAWGNWQKQKGSYHGRALATEIISNQIFINQMMAMVFRHLQTQAFPTKVYNADIVPNLSNEVGTAIGIRNMLPGQNLGDVISTLPAADMSNQIIQAIELCMSYTKECLGATEAQLGNTSATNTSAIMVLQNTSEVPLENIRAGLHAWVEDIGRILLDMMGTYYGERPVLKTKVMKEPVVGTDGLPVYEASKRQFAVRDVERNVLENYDFRQFKKLWLSVSADVGATSYYSEIATVQTLDNLRKDGFISALDYLERVPDKLIPRKQELIEKIKEQMATATGTGANAGNAGAANAGNPEVANAGITGTAGTNAGMPAAGMDLGNGQIGKNRTGYTMGGEIEADKQVSLLPQRISDAYKSLPSQAQKALMK